MYSRHDTTITTLDSYLIIKPSYDVVIIGDDQTKTLLISLINPSPTVSMKRNHSGVLPSVYLSDITDSLPEDKFSCLLRTLLFTSTSKLNDKINVVLLFSS